MPKIDGVVNMRRLLTEISSSGEGSFLAVLKQFELPMKTFSFPIEGYTLALDFKASETAIKTVKKLEDMVVDMGEGLPTKDAMMQESTFKAIRIGKSLR